MTSIVEEKIRVAVLRTKLWAKGEDVEWPVVEQESVTTTRSGCNFAIRCDGSVSNDCSWGMCWVHCNCVNYRATKARAREKTLVKDMLNEGSNTNG